MLNTLKDITRHGLRRGFDTFLPRVGDQALRLADALHKKGLPETISQPLIDKGLHFLSKLGSEKNVQKMSDQIVDTGANLAQKGLDKVARLARGEEDFKRDWILPLKKKFRQINPFTNVNKSDKSWENSSTEIAKSAKRSVSGLNSQLYPANRVATEVDQMLDNVALNPNEAIRDIENKIPTRRRKPKKTPSSPPPKNGPDYNQMRVVDLRKIAAKRKIPKYHVLRKPDLVAALNKSKQQVVQAPKRGGRSRKIVTSL